MEFSLDDTTSELPLELPTTLSTTFFPSTETTTPRPSKPNGFLETDLIRISDLSAEILMIIVGIIVAIALLGNFITIIAITNR